MVLILSEKPMLSISSASSSTILLTMLRSTLPRSMRSISRPGVATMICAPWRRALIWSRMLVPPYTATMLMAFIYLEKSRRSSAICRHSSLVGDSTMACVCAPRGPPMGGWGSTICSSGSPKAAVFPVPVCARAMMSVPLSYELSRGMTVSCMGMGCSKPSSSMARQMSEHTPNSSKVFIGVMGSEE